MPDNPSELERELRALRPAAASHSLDARIAQSMKPAVRDGAGQCALILENARPSRSDKFLLSTLTAAAASLLLIVTLLTADYLNASATSTLAQDPAALTPRNTQHLLAQLASDSPRSP